MTRIPGYPFAQRYLSASAGTKTLLLFPESGCWFRLSVDPRNNGSSGNKGTINACWILCADWQVCKELSRAHPDSATAFIWEKAPSYCFRSGCADALSEVVALHKKYKQTLLGTQWECRQKNDLTVKRTITNHLSNVMLVHLGEKLLSPYKNSNPQMSGCTPGSP